MLLEFGIGAHRRTVQLAPSPHKEVLGSDSLWATFFSEWMMSAAIRVVTHITPSDIRLASHLHASLELPREGLGDNVWSYSGE